MRFIHDNYSGSAYIDNFSTNGQVVGIDNLTNNVDFTHFYNIDLQSLVLESSTDLFKKITIYNSIGQMVMEKELSENSELVDLLSLGNGIYTAQISAGSSVKTIRFLKQ